jgi:hypothetical protein
MPVIHGYLLFLIGSCVEMNARNMHQYSAAKSKKMEEAAMWLERCEAVLSNAMTSRATEYDDVEVAVHTPRMSRQVQPSAGNDLDETPTPMPMIRRPASTLRASNDVAVANWREGVTKSVESMTESINKIIDGDLRNPFHDESDPFLSLSSSNTPQKNYLTKVQDWSLSLPRLTPSPLRIRKAHPPSQVMSFEVLPSPHGNMSFVSGETGLQDEELPNTQSREMRIQAKKEAWRVEIDRRVALGNISCVSGESDLQGEEFPESREMRIQAKKEAWRIEIDRRIALRMQQNGGKLPRIPIHHQFNLKTKEELDISSEVSSPAGDAPKSRAIPRTMSELIHDCFGKEGNANMNASCLGPIPHSSSAKPLPLCLKPKMSEQEDRGDADPNSDRASLARLERAWELSPRNGMRLPVSDTETLHAVEGTWAQLSEEYHLARGTYEAQVARLNDHISSISRSLRKDIFSLRQLAGDIDYNRSSHIQGQKLPQSKSYWSFSVPPKDTIEEKRADDYDEHRDKPAMRLNVGWAAPGTVLNETMEARIARLRKDGFRTVGLRNPKRGHKGDEYYNRLCEEALAETRGLRYA